MLRVSFIFLGFETDVSVHMVQLSLKSNQVGPIFGIKFIGNSFF